jgi:hypothetical protein
VSIQYGTALTIIYAILHVFYLQITLCNNFWIMFHVRRLEIGVGLGGDGFDFQARHTYSSLMQESGTEVRFEASWRLTRLCLTRLCHFAIWRCESVCELDYTRDWLLQLPRSEVVRRIVRLYCMKIYRVQAPSHFPYWLGLSSESDNQLQAPASHAPMRLCQPCPGACPLTSHVLTHNPQRSVL